MRYTVGEVAELAGVTVRTLHHYDAIGLLVPSERTAAGYRCYTSEELERLQQILAYRALGFGLEEIAVLLDDPAARPRDHLARQRKILGERIARLEHMLAAVDEALEADDMNVNLTPEERLELFGDWLPEDYEDEAYERWGDTDAWAQSKQRTARYTADDWRAIQAEGAEIEQGLAAALADGEAPDSERAMDLAEAHRQHLVRWFYDCGHEMHRGLGRMYVDDERFTAYYERVAPGLARFLHEAIEANASRTA
ncbi:MerR family transcriptional regulator [Egibacter rhizosphaerae]|uniref:MerR family transcriptional regulator n=1 Tax=Egibacter rhizosphaerae TaxID=1670831 RepID=A0A411YEV8_9ACTN|nr:MerR family transcriptional regulator [Egibacter rhizosphaerae]QBI19794.1 MerR family transcriptional regulator [Egibacter rhizosphaerae]